MKKLLFGAFLSLCVLAIASCSNDDDGSCQTCTLSLLGIDTSAEICPDGDGVDITTTALGISDTQSVDSTTVAAQVSILEAGGYDCN